MTTDTIFRQRAKAPRPPKAAKPAKADKPRRRGRTASPSLVDPRLQARRVEVARGQGRRRLRWVAAGLLVVVLAVGAFALTRSPVLDVDTVTVRGGAHTQRATVTEAAAIMPGSPMVSLDTATVERRLEALPWVERATVTRSWPGTVRIALVERTPVAQVGSGDGAVEVDEAGRVLGPADASDLPVVAGDPAEVGELLTPTQRWVVATVGGLPKPLRAEVADAAATPAGMRLTLDDGITVRWGDSGQPSAKADAVQVLLEQADRATIDTIDVSVPRAATVTRS